MYASPNACDANPDKRIPTHFCRQDETVKAAAYLFETLVDPETAFSGDARKCALSKVWSPGNSLWEFYDLPGNDFRRKRFGVAMVGFSQTDPAELNGLLESVFFQLWRIVSCVR